MTTATEREVKWIGRTVAARRLGIHLESLNRLIDQGHLTVRQLPGLPVRVLEADVERLAESSVRPATVEG